MKNHFLKNKTGKIEYFVDEEKRTVVAKVSGVHRELFQILSKYGTDSKVSWDRILNIYPDTYRAIAKCAPEDKWDEETGKQIAKNRLITKLCHVRANVYSIVWKAHLEYAEEIWPNIERNRDMEVLRIMREKEIV